MQFLMEWVRNPIKIIFLFFFLSLFSFVCVLPCPPSRSTPAISASQDVSFKPSWDFTRRNRQKKRQWNCDIVAVGSLDLVDKRLKSEWIFCLPGQEFVTQQKHFAIWNFLLNFVCILGIFAPIPTDAYPILTSTQPTTEFHDTSWTLSQNQGPKNTLKIQFSVRCAGWEHHIKPLSEVQLI